MVVTYFLYEDNVSSFVSIPSMTLKMITREDIIVAAEATNDPMNVLITKDHRETQRFQQVDMKPSYERQH